MKSTSGFVHNNFFSNVTDDVVQREEVEKENTLAQARARALTGASAVDSDAPNTNKACSALFTTSYNSFSDPARLQQINQNVHTQAAQVAAALRVGPVSHATHVIRSWHDIGISKPFRSAFFYKTRQLVPEPL